MKTLTVTICLTIAVLLGSNAGAWLHDPREIN
jgi:hypothetical protein